VVADFVLPTNLPAELEKMLQVAYVRQNATKHTTGVPGGTVSKVHLYVGPSKRKKRAQLHSNQMALDTTMMITVSSI
jgi:hypothetical protein